MATVKQPKYKDTFVMEGNTDDIVTTVLEVARESKKQEVQAWARQNFAANYNGLSDLWHWVKDNVKYVEDPDGKQLVKTAARTYHERHQGTDCKSFTIFIVKCLEALNIPYTIRFISQGRSNVASHVYPIAHLGKRNVIMDAVYDTFDKIPKHNKKFDYTMTAIYKLSGIGATNDSIDEKLAKALEHFERVTSFIPDSILDNDITQMSQGEFLRYMSRPLLPAASEAKRTAFMVQTAKMRDAAFQAPLIVASPQEIASLKSAAKKVVKTAKKVVKKAGDVVENVGDAIKDTWRKLVNWIFKEVVEKAAVYFLYLFTDVNTPTVKRKRAKQQTIFNAIAGFSNCDPKMLMGAIEAKLTKRYKMHPKAYLDKVLKEGKSAIQGNDIDAIGCADGVTTIACVSGAITGLITLAKQIMNYLNKNKEEGDEKVNWGNLVGTIKTNNPDLDEFLQETASVLDSLPSKSTKKTTDQGDSSTDEEDSGDTNTNTGGGGSNDTNTMLMVAGGAALLFFAMK